MFLLAYLWFSVLITGIIVIVGMAYQARKTPEQIHMDFLIDTNDMKVAYEYSVKVWGPTNLGAISDDGQMFVLI